MPSPFYTASKQTKRLDFLRPLRKLATTDNLDDLHDNQRQVVEESRRFNVVCCGRRFGKTQLGIHRSAATLRTGQPVGWFAPTYKLMIEVWDELSDRLRDETKRLNKTEMRIEMTNGATFDMWTLDNPDAGRGRKYARVVIDEAAMVRNFMKAWTASIRPTLTDLRGDAWFLSTPKGHNGFWQLYQLGIDQTQTDWAAWQMPTAANPYIDQAEIEAARQMLPERIFAQEYLAEFLEDGGGVFRGVRAAATAELDQKPVANPTVIGVDFAKHEDFTVLTVIDTARRQMVDMDRFNQIDYTVQTQRLKTLAAKWKPHAIVAERNSIGEPLIEQLIRDGLPVQPFTTTNSSKQAIIDGLALAFERREIAILPDETLIAELQAYAMERLPSGLLRYGAPEGFHDDCVMSLALAWYGASFGSPALLAQIAQLN